MHVGKNNPKYEYKMNNSTLSETDLEKDLGILTSSDMSWESHINAVVGKANRQLGLIRSSFKYLDEFTMKLLYKSLVRPHLEYGATIWSPYWQKDKDKLESIQRRATKLESLRGFSYEKRLQKLDLPTLENRRRRGDLIQMYKMSKGFDLINLHHPPDKFSNERESRRHSECIRRQLTHSRHRYNFFTNRVTGDWNGLTQEIIDSTTINQFKNRIDRHFCF